MNDPAMAGPPDGVPVLTEVVDIERWPAESVVDEPDEPAVRQGSSTPLPTEEQLVQRVLAELQQQIDVMLEYRLREILGPLLSRAADSVVRDARSELASTLRDVVARAVAGEIARYRGR